MERFRRDAFDLRQVQERQQQVEAAAAARRLEGMEGRPKSGERRIAGQVDAPGNNSLLPALRWPIINNEGSQNQEMMHERNMFPPSLGLWSQESHDYTGTEQQLQGVSRSGTLMSEHVPVAATPSGVETPRSSVASTPPEGSHLLGNWNLSSLHLNESSANVQTTDVKGQVRSAASLTQLGWKAAAVPKANSLAEIQEEEAAVKKPGEQVTVEAVDQPAFSTGAGSVGLGLRAQPSVSQPKYLREIQEKEAQNAGQLKDGSPAVQKVPMSRVVDPPAWGTVSAITERGSSLFEADDERTAAQVGRKVSEAEASIVKEASVSQSGQVSAQSTTGFDDSDFIEPKESKKNKKRAAKGKSSTPGKTAGGLTSEVSQAASPQISSKSTVVRSVQVESVEENLPAPPSGLLLADFLTLGNEPVVSTQPLPAWSSTPARLAKMGKSLSLKEIQEAEQRAREEQERQNQMLQASLTQKNSLPPSAKPNTLMTRSGSGGAAWQRPGVLNSSAPVVASGQHSKVPASSGSGNSRSKVGVFEDDDDLFWDYGQDAKLSTGPVKQITKSEPLDFPSLLSGQGQGQANKVIVSKPAAATAAAPAFRQVAIARTSPTDFPSLSATAVSVKSAPTKGKKQASYKVTGPQVSAEVKALRQWCENQLKKLSLNEDVTNLDFSIVDFCISLPSVSEASDYLSQYLGTLPGVTQQHIQSFKKEFVRRKEQLPSDGNVSSSDREDTDAFFSSNGKKVDRSKSGTMDMARLLKEDTGSGELESTASPGSGKKKNKKGKKVVDPSLLGFSVTSNRIMMGEIHHLDD